MTRRRRSAEIRVRRCQPRKHSAARRRARAAPAAYARRAPSAREATASAGRAAGQCRRTPAERAAWPLRAPPAAGQSDACGRWLPRVASIYDAPEPTLLTFGDVERTVRRLRDAVGAVGGLHRIARRVRAGEA